MAIQDSDAERRNLVMTSLGFIIYFVADGHIINDELKIQLLNIGFNNSHILGVAAWVMLFWFAMRYWQTHKGQALKTLVSDISHVAYQGNKSLLIWYTEKCTGLSFEQNNGFVFGRFSIDKDGWTVHYSEVENYEKRNDGGASYKEIIKKTLSLSGFYGFILKVLYVMTACLTRSGFSSYSIPYILFYMAIFISVIHI